MIKKVKNLVFDLDDTLYPASLGYRDLSWSRIPLFFKENMNLSLEQYDAEITAWKEKGGTSKEYFESKGTNIETLVAFACELDMSKVSPNPVLGDMLSNLSHRKIIYTDANRKHAKETLQLLGVDNFFNEIFTFLEGGGIWKHEKGAFDRFLEFYNLNADETIIFEDSLANLEKAKEAGLITALISEKETPKPTFCDYIFQDITSALKLFV